MGAMATRNQYPPIYMLQMETPVGHSQSGMLSLLAHNVSNAKGVGEMCALGVTLAKTSV